MIDQPATDAEIIATRKPSASRISRRRFFGRIVLAGATPISLAGYATQVEPFWLDAHETSITIPQLPPGFDGFRVAHLTDMHAGEYVKMSYLRRVVARMMEMRPDVVAVTGDLVNHTADTIQPVAQMLGEIDVPVIVSFGNHDYAPNSARPRAWTILADPLQRALEERGCIVLRNASHSIQRGGERIWFVGLEDLYTTRFWPPAAYARVNRSETIIALSHNPDSSSALQNWNTRLVLSGHTHGGQVRIPFFGAPVLPLLHRRYEQGLFQLRKGCQLYVSRGVGFLWRLRFCCRPELPLIVLRCSLPS